ncbi:MAG TPA: hypothetical protein VM737_01685 [Gemmatimonadota bacterium]|nr:hypothetical protein [Gemmatimonadota bacterium]
MRALAVAERRRWRQRLIGMAAVAGAGSVLSLLIGESVLGPGGGRIASYALVAAGVLVVGVGIARRWRAPAPDALSIAGRLERLYPQARGALIDAVSAPAVGRVGSLAAARVEAAGAWVERRTLARLDGALARDERDPAWRRLALVLAGIAAIVALGEPAAARRLGEAIRDPASLWGQASGAWTVTPGDTVVAYGEPVAGRARFTGLAAEGPLILEFRPVMSAWRAETLAARPAGTWRWPSVRAGLRYRLRYGSFTSPAYQIEIEAPLALENVEVRRPGEEWTSLAGRVVPAGSPLEFRGRATGALARARIRLEGGARLPLEVEGAAFEGALRVPEGTAEVVVRDSAGAVAAGARFRAATPGRAFVEILRPEEEPLILATGGAWIEVRAGAPEGLRDLLWETGDGGAGALATVGGARDTTVAGIVPLAAGRAPGDTVRYRVVARPSPGGGPAAASRWRTAVVAGSTALDALAAGARDEAAARVDRALEAVRESPALASGAGASPDTREAAQELDRTLQAAADSLAQALDRTLTGPGVPPGLAERLEGFRRLLEGTARAPLTPPAGLPDDPAAAAHTRASLLEAIREGLAEIDRLMELSRAADTLSQLAESEDALAEQSRRSRPGEIETEIAERQAAVTDAAREASEPLSDALAAGVEQALGEVDAALAQTDPAAVATAQGDAADALAEAASGARREVVEASARAESQRAAMDRAGAETLFLADRQRELAERMAPGADPVSRAGSAEHADRVSRQQVVTRGLEATLAALVEAIGGRPAGFDLARLLAEAVFATRYAEEAVASPPGRGSGARSAAAATHEAARTLALLARAFLLPESESGGGAGAGAEGNAGAVARQLEAMAGAQRSLADAMAGGAEPVGGNAEAAAAQRGIGRRLEDLAEELRDLGIDPRTIRALAESVERTAARLERGLPGAESETDLRALARRFADLGRILEQSTTERRRSETARAFLPAGAPPLPERTTAPRLDPAAALGPWEDELPKDALGPARAYLERLAAEGVRAPGESP